MREDVIRRTRIPKEVWPPEDAWPLVKPTSLVEWKENFNLGKYLLDRNVDEGRGQKAAIFFKDRRISYEELSKQSDKLGSSLKRLGVASGHRVAIRLTNRPEFVVSDFALQKIGAIPVPTFILLKAPSITHIINDANIKTIIVEAALINEVEKAGMAELEHVIVLGGDQSHKDKGFLLWEELLRDGEETLQSTDIYFHDATLIHYTSGTTGAPKGCIQTPTGLLGHIAGTVNRAGITENDVLCISPPLPFAYGHAALMYTLYSGCTCILFDKFSPEEFVKQASKYKATVIVGVPTFYRMMISDIPNYDWRQVRLLMTAGETFTQELELQLKSLLPNSEIFNFYGYTEMWNFIGTIPGVHSPTSLGIPYDEYQIMVVDEETGEQVSTGRVGMIKAHGAAGAFYWGLPEKQRELVKDGWFYSGDLAYVDEEGIFHFKARDVDIIKSSGYLIAPYEIEATLSENPAVELVGCVGVPDPLKGEVIKAFIKLKKGHSPSEALIGELEQFVESRLETYKVPKEWEFVEQMPTTPSGKVLRKKLKES